MDYKNKKILFLGDSITALGVSDRGWIKYFNEIIEPLSFVNLAVSGARLSNSRTFVEFDGNPEFLGDNTNYKQNVVANQIEKLARGKDPKNKHYSRCKEYDSFDLIIIAAGTNDDFVKEKCNIDAIGDQFIRDNHNVEIQDVDCFTWPGAMRYIYEKLRNFYPEAKICFCSPIQAVETVRSYHSTLYKRNLMSAVCDRISDVIFIDTFRCGICGVYEKEGGNGRDLIDGLHPNKNGAKKIGVFNARTVIKSIY